MQWKVLDIESTGLDPFKSELLCVGWGDKVYRFDEFFGSEAQQQLADPEVAKVCHTKIDVRYLRQQEWVVNGPIFDSQVMAWVINENQFLDLESLASKYLGVEMDKRIRSVSNVPYFRLDSGKEVPMSWFIDNPEAPEWQQLLDYNLRDIQTTAQLYERLREMLTETAWDKYYDTEEVPFTSVLLNMECNGMPIDLNANEQLGKELEVRQQDQTQTLNDQLGYEGVNYGSWKQLIDVLFSKLWYQKDVIKHGLDLRKPTLVSEIAAAHSIPKNSVDEDAIVYLKDSLVDAAKPSGFTLQKVTHQNLVGFWTRKGLGLKPTPPEIDKDGKKANHPSTRTSALLVHHGANEFVQSLVQWRKVEKARGYVEAYPRFSHNSRVYPSFKQTGTKTGRISCTDPNLMQVPAHGPLGEAIRSVFTGNLVVGDYSQLEPRLMAHFSQDPVLLDTYRTGKDIYLVIAEGIFGQKFTKEDDERQVSKTIFLAGPSYGASAKKVAEILFLNGHTNIAGEAITPALTQGLLDEMYQLLSGLREYRENVISYVHHKGYVTTIGGRHRRLSHAKDRSNYRLMQYGERQAVNAIIQGSAGDIVRRAMVRLDRELPQMPLLIQVHDEVVGEVTTERWGKDFELLAAVEDICSTGHGFDLTVPLVFEPSYCKSWAEKGSGGIELPADWNDLDEVA